MATTAGPAMMMAGAGSMLTVPKGSPVKRRAACDECRTKKLKCTGEQPACSRCVREHIACMYSPQKQMGRPKKRPRTEDGATADNNGGSEMGAAGAASHTQSSPLPPQWDGTTSTWLGMSHANSALDDYLTTAGNVQPWLQNSEWAAYSGHSIPGVTPDSSSHSPPIISLSPELQSGSYAYGQSHGHDHGSIPHCDNSTQLLLDPSFATSSNESNLGVPHSGGPSCACLSTMYLTLNALQHMDSITFPFSLHTLREAMQTSSEVLSCDQCPQQFITAIQNTQLIGTLLMSIAERFGKVLHSINDESTRAHLAGETKKFRLADLNTSTSHLHTGGLGCAAAFTLDLSPSEWRSMAKKVVRAEVHGPSDGNTCCPYLMGLATQMQERHEKSFVVPVTHDFPRDKHGVPLGGRHIPKEDHLCIKLAAYSVRLIEGFDWT